MDQDNNSESNSNFQLFESFPQEFIENDLECLEPNYPQIYYQLSHSAFWFSILPSHAPENREYTTKASYPRVPAVCQPDKDRHFKISVIRSQCQLQGKEFIINEQGMVGSLKDSDNDDIIIGRGMEHRGMRPNDLVLSDNDRQISRIHTKLILKDEFVKYNKVPREFYLMIWGMKKIGKSLNMSELARILQLTRYTPKITVKDISNRESTLVKLSNKKGRPIAQNNQFLIGAETRFIIRQVRCLTGRDQRIEDHNRMIHSLKARLPDINIRERKDIRQQLGKERPFLLLDMKSQLHQQQFEHYLLLGDAFEGKQYFKIGRNQESEVLIPNNTISRKQCRIVFEPDCNQWMIYDGEESKESSNGSWIELKGTQDTFECPIDVKISETVLRVEMVNFGQTMKKQMIF